MPRKTLKGLEAKLAEERESHDKELKSLREYKNYYIKQLHDEISYLNEKLDSQRRKSSQLKKMLIDERIRTQELGAISLGYRKCLRVVHDEEIEQELKEVP